VNFIGFSSYKIASWANDNLPINFIIVFSVLSHQLYSVFSAMIKCVALLSS
jgi:hypothetical protein